MAIAVHLWHEAISAFGPPQTQNLYKLDRIRASIYDETFRESATDWTGTQSGLSLHPGPT